MSKKRSVPKAKKVEVEDESLPEVESGNTRELEPKTEAQRKYIAALTNSQITFGVGPAGTGKTFVATTLAADLLRNKKIKRIIITRPAVEAGESLGYLPGFLDEKFEPYFAPVRSVFTQRLGKSATDYYIKRKAIDVLPLAYMRGHTFSDAFVIFDEAQNASKTQMKTFLTRIGHNCRVAVNGDPKQVDVKKVDGLMDAINRLSGIRGVEVVNFGVEDIVRSGIVGRIVRAYEA